MRIIIEVKETATLNRINEIGKMLRDTKLSDVIESIDAEW